ncbi:LysM peptidoglycan-binding domain-containing protein [Marinicrinis lubricantis]|uniref:LysM peptidoglycan-binding domain-containing protein n=1 Tax=Marinicrinis lubricantis TaxID=2086470 RepID=A0ABW1ITW0_9BACL
MTGEQKGLRFDIYERVQLQEPLEGLEQLDSIELLPQIKVLSKEEQAVLKGHLTLTGSYTVSEDRGSRQLVHYIPVEITLPLSRITSLEDLKVEIEHFDVDLISPRSLSVTGVLSLEGIEMVGQVSKTWGTPEEVFVSQMNDDLTETSEAIDKEYSQINDQTVETRDASAERFEPSAASQFSKSSGAGEEQAIEPAYSDGRVEEAPAVQEEAPKETAPKEKAPKEEAVPIPIVNEESPLQVDLPMAETKAEPVMAQEMDNSAAGNEAIEPSSNEQNPNPAGELAEEENPNQSPAAEEAAEQEPPKKKEMKIAFGSKKQEEDVSSEEKKGSKGLKSLLHREQTKNVLENYKQAEEALEALQQPEDAKNGLEWKSLFLNRENEEQSFKKVRMCIVQKEETLGTIAQKYGIHPRELSMYNRLSNEEVSEGQIVYIPN